MVRTNSAARIPTRELQYAGVLIGIIVGALLVRQDDCAAAGTSCFNLIQFSLNGVLVGGLYALVALGIVIINKASGVFNFAHGYMMLIGGLLFWQTFQGTPSTQLSLILAGVAASVVMSVVSTGIEISPREGENSLQRLIRRMSTPRFMMAAAAGLVTGAIIYWLFQNLEHQILRGALGSIIGSSAIGLVAERFAIRPLLGQPVLSAIMMTLAISLLLQGMVALFWGTQSKELPIFNEPAQESKYLIGIDADGNNIYAVTTTPGSTKPNYTVSTTDLLGKDLSFQRNLVWGFVIAISCFIGFVIFFQFTSMGLMMRAVAENQVLGESIGLRVRTILAVAWAIAATMAMVAGVVQGTGPGVGVSTLVIPSLAFRAFPAVLLGGLESITGALVGGLIIGVVEALTISLIDPTTGQEFAPFALLLIVLMIRPDGLFGQRRIDRV